MVESYFVKYDFTIRRLRKVWRPKTLNHSKDFEIWMFQTETTSWCKCPVESLAYLRRGKHTNVGQWIAVRMKLKIEDKRPHAGFYNSRQVNSVIIYLDDRNTLNPSTMDGECGPELCCKYGKWPIMEWIFGDVTN